MTRGNQDRLRIGIAGCGYQGGNLAQAIARLDAMAVVACADPDAEAAKSLAARAGNATPYKSADDMLAQAELDAVIVATSHDALAEVSLQAAQAGLHVMAEKPVALSVAELTQVEQAVAEAGVCYMASPPWISAPGGACYR